MSYTKQGQPSHNLTLQIKQKIGIFTVESVINRENKKDKVDKSNIQTIGAAQKEAIYFLQGNYI